MTDRLPDRLEERIELIQRTGHVHSEWYRDTYPDVRAFSMSASEHYLRYGARLGYNPGKGFDTRYYLDTHPELIESGLNPLLHYAVEGAQRGDLPKPAAEFPARNAGRREIEVVRAHLLSLGFTNRPVHDLETLAATHEDPDVRARAYRELALWSMREKEGAGYRSALEYVAAAPVEGVGRSVLSRLATIEILCRAFLGEREQGLAAWARTAGEGLVDADVALARVNLAAEPEARVALVNTVLRTFGVPEVSLLPDAGRVYDRLTAAHPVRSADGPKVSVLVAAYNAADTLPTALRSLTEQSWRNLEILVLDDASPDGGATSRLVRAHSAADPRIRLIRLEENGGAYVARNRGLDEATGEFVTIHDADDWSHPKKIEIQVRHLLAHPDTIGCTTDQARATSDLAFTRWTGRGQFLIGNTSSFLFRRAPVRTHFGYWDTVRFSADNELIRRIRKRFGASAVKEMHVGPYSFQRDSETSIIASGPLGINGFLFGVRREYFDAQQHYRDTGGDLKYGADPAVRPFPVPAIMRPERNRLARDRHHGIVYAADFRWDDDDVADCLETIAVARKCGQTVGLAEMYRYDIRDGGRLPMQDALRRAIDGETVEIIGYGEEVSCDLLVLRDPAILQEPQRYVPRINARHVKIIANRPPLRSSGSQHYRPVDCDRHARRYFGTSPHWHPTDPAQRAAFHALDADALGSVALLQDWPETTDTTTRAVLPKRSREDGRPLRLGRFGPDRPEAWPTSEHDIRSLCPEGSGREMHVMGGAAVPASILGTLPPTWAVHPERAMPLEAFLAGIDVFVQAGGPGAPRRPVIEAMAAGVPVILTEDAQSVFGDAVLYAPPRDWAALATTIDTNAAARAAQVAKARAFLKDRFSPTARRALLDDCIGAKARRSENQT